MDQHQQARNLYFQTDMKQADIAALVGINDKTLYRWIQEGNWKQMKTAAKQAPLAIVEMLYKQLYELNNAICTRESPIPTLQEAETTRKLINSIDKLKKQASLSENIQILMAFTGFLTRIDLDLAKTVVKHADHYLKERMGNTPIGFYEDDEEELVEEMQPATVQQQQEQNVSQQVQTRKKDQTTAKEWSAKTGDTHPAPGTKKAYDPTKNIGHQALAHNTPEEKNVKKRA